MYRLVVSDIDGTIFGGDEIIPTEAPAFVKELEKNGLMFSIATGRSDSTATWIVNQLGLSIPFVASNGATVVDPEGRRLLHRNFLIGHARSIIDRAEETGLSVIYTIDGIEYITKEAEYILSHQKRFSHDGCLRPLTEEDWKTLEVEKISIMSTFDDDHISELEAMCQKNGNHFRYTRYMDRSVELVHAKATKASGVRYLATLLGISMEDVVFVGDHQNDIELMQASGLGIAVANATADAKASADIVVSQPLFEGVKEAIVNHVLGVL